MNPCAWSDASPNLTQSRKKDNLSSKVLEVLISGHDLRTRFSGGGQYNRVGEAPIPNPLFPLDVYLSGHGCYLIGQVQDHRRRPYEPESFQSARCSLAAAKSLPEQFPAQFGYHDGRRTGAARLDVFCRGFAFR